MLNMGGRPRDRAKERLRKIVASVGVAALAVLLVYSAYRRWTLLEPPVDEGPALSSSVRVERTETDPRLWVDDDWLQRRAEGWHLRIHGDARRMGHVHGLLCARLATAFEQDVAAVMSEHLPAGIGRLAWDNLARWRLRELPSAMAPNHVAELAALARAAGDSEEAVPLFHRLAHLHAMYDIATTVDPGERSPISGGVALATWGRHTVDGRLLVGRTFELQGASAIDRNRSILIARPSDRLAFVSVAWPGMIGVLTGVNSARLSVALNAARTDHAVRTGVPAVFVARQVLERARSIAEAVEIVKQSARMRAFALLVADGKVPQAAVIEASPEVVVVRRSKKSYLALTNHLLHQRYKADATNDRLRRYTSSEVRHRRLLQLLRRFSGRLDAETVALILRNRTGLDDQPLAVGHRSALDALSAVHGVVIDLTDFVMWVANGPDLLGPMTAIDLKAALGDDKTAPIQRDPIAADPALGSAEIREYRLAREQMAYARKLVAAGDSERALGFGRRAVGLAPKLPDSQKLLGDLLWQSGQQEQAKKHYRVFLSVRPARKADVEQVEERLAD